MNKVILVGRITKDLELKRTNSDIPFVQFTLAVNRMYQNKSGEKQTDFINCVAWRQTAELLSKYMRKGNQIGVEGQLQTRTYDDPNGQRRYITEVMCENVHFLEPKRQDDNRGYDAYGDVPSERPSNQPSSFRDDRRNQPVKEESPFENINSQFDISNDDLPF